jgi:hypothetical protein
MRQKTAVEMISRRRMLGILGASVAFGIGAPAAVLTASEAEAQTSGAQPSGGQPSGAQPSGAQPSGAQPSGTGQDRSDNVTQRRQRHAKRRAARHKALAQQEGRKRSSKGTGSTSTTGQGPARQ